MGRNPAANDASEGPLTKRIDIYTKISTGQHGQRRKEKEAMVNLKNNSAINPRSGIAAAAGKSQLLQCMVWRTTG